MCAFPLVLWIIFQSFHFTRFSSFFSFLPSYACVFIYFSDIDPVDNIPVINNTEFPALPTKEIIPEPEITVEKRPFFQKSASEVPENKSVRTLTFENSNLSGRNSIERDVPPPRGKPVVFGRQPERGSRKPMPRGARGSGRGDFNNRRGRGMRHISPRFLENRVNNLNSDFEHLHIEDNGDVSNSVHTDKIRQIGNGKLLSFYVFVGYCISVSII